MCLIPDADLYNAITARPRRGGHRPHRPFRRHRYRARSPAGTSTPTSSSPPPACSCRRWAGPRSAWTAWRSITGTASSTRRTCSKTCPTCSGVWVTRMPLGRCAPTSRARATAKLLAHMASHGYTHAYPHRGNEPMAVKPSWDIQAGYVQRSAARAAQVGHQAAVECAAELPRRRHRLPVRPHRGGDGVRPRRRPGPAGGVRASASARWLPQPYSANQGSASRSSGRTFRRGGVPLRSSNRSGVRSPSTAPAGLRVRRFASAPAYA